ncbi:GGDEF domain-containing protein [Rhizobiaceae bacterium BDR2-2]|uniref:GGDEF domain-containing protein n=1 Tax=Ectorhizobium quercum TaxID=2965071 RepID=A0AAE3SWZ7_9HYPH|nr:GGDEF domain-containing protein [Ectorhizobium quercum]MCX8998544.1 GGDEF domain-containing protein [Ectorhizobium quercum]
MPVHTVPQRVPASTPGAADDGLFQRLAHVTLETAFQPIVEATSGRLAAWEALMRNHERAGFASPLALLDFADSIGALLPLEKLMVRTALEKFVAQPDRGGLQLFLNLDSRLIGEGEGLVPRLCDHLDDAGLAPSFLCFELSERFDLTQHPDFRPLMERMRQAGFRFAIDDFGAGVGEMKLLCDYPVDYVKIDRYFVSGIGGSAPRRHIVGNLVATAHRLGVAVVAEGVETAEEAEACRDLGVDFLQGWFIGRPEIEVPQARTFSHLRRREPPASPTAGFDRGLILARIEHPQSLVEDEGVERAFDIFRASPGQGYLPILGRDGAPRGILKEERLKEYIYQPFGRDLLKNRIYSRTVSHFTDRAPVAELDMASETMLGAFAGVEDSPCLILTDGGAYAGVVSAASLLRVMHEKSLRAAQDQNPLTGLPGNRAISDYLAAAAGEAGGARYFCYCDFDHFKPFNDIYGFQKGDHAIMLFAALMRRYFFVEGTFLGHVGGDDFFIGLSQLPREDVLDMLSRLSRDFHNEVAGLYSPQARLAGSVKGRDRSGAEKDYPLMRCSVGILELPAGRKAASVDDLAVEITALKADAKKSETGLVLRRF